MPFRKNEFMRSLTSLWINWTFTIGAVAVAILLSLVLRPVYVPMCMLVLVSLLVALYRANHATPVPMCSHIVWVGIRALLWSAIIMLIINLLNTKWLLGRFFDASSLNSDVPFIASLIIFPVFLIVNIISMIMMGRTSACVECKERHGFTLEEGFLGNFVHREVRYQSRLLIYISTFLTGVGWVYYFFFYINVNLNSPDTFFFVILPVAIYALSVLYLGVRYLGISHYVSLKQSATVTHDASLLRFLIVKGDYMLLQECPIKGLNGLTQWDTPAIERLHFRENISDEDARHRFIELSGCTGEFRMRRIYSTRSFSNDTNLFHYAIFLPDSGMDDFITNARDHGVKTNTPDDSEGITLKGSWLTLYHIDQLYRSNRLSPALATEIHRIFTITMAWKTYDLNGRRLNPIKNYRPTFRLRDFKNWDVDYEDLRWLGVSTNNEDHRFYNVRRFWRRLFNGA